MIASIWKFLQLHLKRDSGTGVFLWILRNFFCRTPMLAAPELNKCFLLPLVKVVYHTTESILGPKMWGMAPTEIRKTSSINKFTKLIRKWVPQKGHYRLFKPYITFGFVSIASLIWSIVSSYTIYLLSETLTETWVRKMSIKLAIPIWYCQVLTA